MKLFEFEIVKKIYYKKSYKAETKEKALMQLEVDVSKNNLGEIINVHTNIHDYGNINDESKRKAYEVLSSLPELQLLSGLAKKQAVDIIVDIIK
jgi:hypothetical protein